MIRDRQPWYDNRLSYNPAVHRIKQAMFHCAVITDLAKTPLPAPHPELTKYMRPPTRVIRRAAEAINNCRSAMSVQKGKSPPFLKSISDLVTMLTTFFSREGDTETEERPRARQGR